MYIKISIINRWIKIYWPPFLSKSIKQIKSYCKLTISLHFCTIYFIGHVTSKGTGHLINVYCLPHPAMHTLCKTMQCTLYKAHMLCFFSFSFYIWLTHVLAFKPSFKKKCFFCRSGTMYNKHWPAYTHQLV